MLLKSFGSTYVKSLTVLFLQATFLSLVFYYGSAIFETYTECLLLALLVSNFDLGSTLIEDRVKQEIGDKRYKEVKLGNLSQIKIINHWWVLILIQLV